MRSWRFLILLAVISVLVAYRAPVRAQTSAPTLLSLQSSVTDLKTGQAYDVDIHVDNINELWLGDIEVQYDPALVYILGTKAGSPVHLGSMWTPPESTTVVQNSVSAKNIVYTISLLAPANPVSGSGSLGSFKIYPLAPGSTQLTFSKVDLLKVDFATDASGQRVGNASEHLTFTPVLLKLNITGQKVDPPQEATATPIPTDTQIPEATVAAQPTQLTPTALVNATAGPTATPTPLALVPVPTAANNSSLLIPLIIVVLIALVGLVVLLALWFRSRRRSG